MSGNSRYASSSGHVPGSYVFFIIMSFRHVLCRSVFNRHAFSGSRVVFSSVNMVRLGVLIFEEALINSSNLGTPKVTFLALFPALWNVLSVICIVGSPTLCAAIVPTISPGATIDLCHFLKSISITFWNVFLEQFVSFLVRMDNR